MQHLLNRLLVDAPPYVALSDCGEPIVVANHWTAVIAQLIAPAQMLQCRVQFNLPSASVQPYALAWWTNELLASWVETSRDLVICASASVAEASWLTGVSTSRASEIRGQSNG